MSETIVCVLEKKKAGKGDGGIITENGECLSSKITTQHI